MSNWVSLNPNLLQKACQLLSNRNQYRLAVKQRPIFKKHINTLQMMCISNRDNNSHLLVLSCAQALF